MSSIGPVPIGVGLPGFVPGPSPRELLEFARLAEALGFDSLWLPEHLLAPPAFHSHAWLEPLATLSFLAGATRRIRVGTAVLVLPLRHPVLLSKEIATIQHLTDGRLILGVGAGWSPSEFEAMGVSLERRGRITDEHLATLERLLDGQLEPQLAQPLEVWVGGGSQLAHPDSVQPPTIQPSVLSRIVRSSGWLSRTTADLAQLGADWSQINDAVVAVGRRPGDVTFVHKNYFHVVPGASTEAAFEIQMPLFDALGGGRDPAYVRQVHFVGSVEDIIAAANARLAAGVRYLIFAGVTADPHQLELLRSLVVPHLEVGTDPRAAV